jgi:hypothetical protein
MAAPFQPPSDIWEVNRSGVADRLIEHRGRIADIVQARGDPDEAQRIREAAAGTTQATRE